MVNLWLAISAGLLLISCSTSAKPQHIRLQSFTAPVVDIEAFKPSLNILSSYSTLYDYVDKKHAPRAFNIELIAKKLDGTKINPGEEFSFNQHVGIRSHEAGFKDAPVIFMGELAQDVGGGSCQTSSTLYAASLLAGLEITDRRPHSRPSAYIRKGFDATVVYPPECANNPKCYSADLKFKNNYKSSIELHYKIEPVDARQRKLTVAILGTDAAPTVQVRWLQGQTVDYKRRYRKSNKFKSDHRAIVQHGIPGTQGILILKYTMTDHKWSKHIPSIYRPVDEIWDVGLAWDMNKEPWNK